MEPSTLASPAPHPVQRSAVHFQVALAGTSDPSISAISGCIAGLLSGVLVCPLDVIKTKLQAQGSFSINKPRRPVGRSRGGLIGMGGSGLSWSMRNQVLVYRGLVGTARTIWLEEGPRGMYKGLGPLTLGYMPTWTIYFTVYGEMQDALNAHNTVVAPIISAMAAGSCATFSTNPIWVIKSRLMSQTAVAAVPNTSATFLKSPYHYTSSIDAVRKMYLHEGIRSFYTGLAPAHLGLLHVGVQFPLYELFKVRFKANITTGEQPESGGTRFWGILAASSLSKICASSITYPHEVIRTRLQVQKSSRDGKMGFYPRYHGIIHCMKALYKEEGWRAFYAGMSVNILRAVPASIVTLVTFELISSKLRHERAKLQGGPVYR